jgi:hypothetical protein
MSAVYLIWCGYDDGPECYVESEAEAKRICDELNEDRHRGRPPFDEFFYMELEPAAGDFVARVKADRTRDLERFAERVRKGEIRP